MRYFETTLPLDKVKSLIEKAALNYNKDTCIANLNDGRNVIASAHLGLDRALSSDPSFKEIQLDEHDRLDITHLHNRFKVNMISGNQELFN